MLVQTLNDLDTSEPISRRTSVLPTLPFPQEGWASLCLLWSTNYCKSAREKGIPVHGEGHCVLWAPRAELGWAVELWQQGGMRNSPLSPTNNATSFEGVRLNKVKVKYWEKESNYITCQKYLTASNSFFTWLTVVPGSKKHWSRRTLLLESSYTSLCNIEKMKLKCFFTNLSN